MLREAKRPMVHSISVLLSQLLLHMRERALLYCFCRILYWFQDLHRERGAEVACDLSCNCDSGNLHLQENDFGDAWRLATVNRVDLNVLVDYAWPRFLEHGRDFVAAVGDDQAVCDLLAALKDGSVTAPGGLYARALPDPPADQVHEPSGLQLNPGTPASVRTCLNGMQDMPSESGMIYPRILW